MCRTKTLCQVSCVVKCRCLHCKCNSLFTSPSPSGPSSLPLVSEFFPAANLLKPCSEFQMAWAPPHTLGPLPNFPVAHLRSWLCPTKQGWSLECSFLDLCLVRITSTWGAFNHTLLYLSFLEAQFGYPCSLRTVPAFGVGVTHTQAHRVPCVFLQLSTLGALEKQLLSISAFSPLGGGFQWQG